MHQCQPLALSMLGLPKCCELPGWTSSRCTDGAGNICKLHLYLYPANSLKQNILKSQPLALSCLGSPCLGAGWVGPHSDVQMGLKMFAIGPLNYLEQLFFQQNRLQCQRLALSLLGLPLELVMAGMDCTQMSRWIWKWLYFSLLTIPATSVWQKMAYKPLALSLLGLTL